MWDNRQQKVVKVEVNGPKLKHLDEHLRLIRHMYEIRQFREAEYLRLNIGQGLSRKKLHL